MTIIDHAAGLPDRAAGALRGAADAVQGVRHQAASDDLSPHPRRPRGGRAGTLACRPARPQRLRARRLPRAREPDRRRLADRQSEVRSRTAVEPGDDRSPRPRIGGGTVNAVTRWPESPAGEKWSSNHHRHAHAGESDLPNHIASIRPAPGHDPEWDRHPSLDYSIHDPEPRPHRAAAAGKPGGRRMSWIGDMADRAAGALQGARDRSGASPSTRPSAQRSGL